MRTEHGARQNQALASACALRATRKEPAGTSAGTRSGCRIPTAPARAVRSIAGGNPCYAPREKWRNEQTVESRSVQPNLGHALLLAEWLAIRTSRWRSRNGALGSSGPPGRVTPHSPNWLGPLEVRVRVADYSGVGSRTGKNWGR